MSKILDLEDPPDRAAFLFPEGRGAAVTMIVYYSGIDSHKEALGRGRTYMAIGVALLLSAITSHTLGDPLTIVIASAVTFALSETLGTEIFTRLRATLGCPVLISGAAGGTVDSTLFVIIGLSPLGAGFIPWAAVPLAILGQFIVKLAVQFIGVVIIKFLKGAKPFTS